LSNSLDLRSAAYSFPTRRSSDLYALEMYKPVEQRIWGYYALPVLHLDRLVGKVDARTDHEAGVLRVDRLHEDAPWSGSVRSAVRSEEHTSELQSREKLVCRLLLE